MRADRLIACLHAVAALAGSASRPAAFSYGLLEELRRTKITVGGQRRRLLDEVDLITGVSGGGFI